MAIKITNTQSNKRQNYNTYLKEKISCSNNKNLCHNKKKIYLISLPKFNLPLYVTHAARALYSHDCRERELTLDHIHTFLTTQGHGVPPRMRNQLNAVAISETKRTWKTIHTSQASIHSNKANMKSLLWRPNDIRGPCGPKSSCHLSFRWGKTPKNLTQDTCPDRESNPGPLRDRRTCYSLLHSGGLY